MGRMMGMKELLGDCLYYPPEQLARKSDLRTSAAAARKISSAQSRRTTVLMTHYQYNRPIGLCDFEMVSHIPGSGQGDRVYQKRRSDLSATTLNGEPVSPLIAPVYKGNGDVMTRPNNGRECVAFRITELGMQVVEQYLLGKW